MNNYQDFFGVHMLPPPTGPDFEVFGISYHTHFDDRDICSMRDGIVITIFCMSFFIGKQRKYENLP